jgi:hypothetical protein
MAGSQHDTFKANWKCLLACLLVSMSPFQYGVDFGLIGGIQVGDTGSVEAVVLTLREGYGWLP